jgi:hypothetical protein
LERAFELAASGKFVSVEEIRRRLSDEGYFTGAVCGPLLCRQLVSIMAKARLAYVVGDHCRVAPHSRQESLDSCPDTFSTSGRATKRSSMMKASIVKA